MKKSNATGTDSINFLLRGLGMAAWLYVASVVPMQAQTWSNPHLGGYLGVNYDGAANTYNAGYTMYVALLGRPQYAYYSPQFQASLQIGTWMSSECNPGIYCTIEGGPGVGGGYGNHWCNHGFGIGAVAGNGFTNFANGTSSGRGVGVYGAAQISPRLLYPPKLEMFRTGTKGQLLGYGYLALPLLPGKATTDGVDVPTGDRWWTLFFNTRNFQGPVAVLTPHFFSQVTKNNTNAAGKMLDSCWAGPNKSIANESHYVPGRQYDGPEGSFLRVAPVFSAINHGTNGSIALNSPTVYDQTALWNAAQQWFNHNGPAPVGPFNTQGAALQTPTGGSFGWGIFNSPHGAVPLDVGTTMGFYTPDPATWGYKWGTNQVSYTEFADGTPAAVMPEFYQLQAGAWRPVSATAVPSQLASHSFDSGSPPPTIATYTVPDDPVWNHPGPAAGPFQVRIEDGDVVTYYWYRFADQPAIMKAGLTEAERDQLQANVEKIHRAWTNGGTYLALPTMGELCDVDPALLVTPPAGLEIGYVPIATSQAWGGWVTNTWHQATSGNWSTTANWAAGSAPEAGGRSYYRIHFAPGGSYTTTNDLSSGYGYGGLAVNQLNFSGAVTLAGNPITLTADVEAYPQINQNSGSGVVINTPLKLDVSTTLGGTGSGLVVISNVISGPWHSLTLTNSGTWRICGLTPNTYGGGTLIKRGTLIWGATTNGVSPDCSHALGSGPVTLHRGATLQFEHARPTNALTLNGGTLHAANRAGVSWMGPVTLNSNTTARADFAMAISGNINGAGGLIKTGTNTLTLSGSNVYTGANLVQAGTLSCSQPVSLVAGALSISNGAVVNLNYSGTRSIFSLNLGGTNKLAGVYGSANSPATNQHAHFTGSGTVTVPVPVSLTNLPATGITTHQATLNAGLDLTLAYGGTNATVLVYWGTANGGTNPAAWANSAVVGQWTHVLSTNISYTATGLVMHTNTTCYFAFLATNSTYTVWATNVSSFTLPTKLTFTSVPDFPPARFPFSVTVQAQDADGNPQTVTSATTVQLSKVSGAGTLSGTASGMIPSGSSSAVISGAAYSAADTMTLTVTASSGMGLAAGVSPPIKFMPPDLTWDANGSAALVRDGGGVWSNSTNTWWNGTTNVNWADNYNAQFGAGGAGGTITLDAVTANLVTFTNFSGTYTLTSGTLNVLSHLTVANSAGAVVLGYVIAGPGGVTMDSSSSLRIYGLSPNTYSGGTIINRGTLIWGTMVNHISPECNYALGTGPVTLNSGATLQFERVKATNALILNGGTLHSANGWGVTWRGPVTVDSNTTLRTDYRMEFTGNISGTGGFIKTGGNTVTLSGTNTYTGANVVRAGTLSCSRAASLGAGALSISNGAVANLNYSGTRTILALTLGGTNMAPGIYGSASSSATHKHAHFSGTGTVTVLASSAGTNTPATAITSRSAGPNASRVGNPNILILFADDLGYGDPGCYNPESKIATPHIDRLAREGLRFTDAHAPGPLCHPSRYGLLTGRYPFRTDISRWPTQPLIEKGQVTIASFLRDHGYRTAMVGKWHLGFREEGYDKPLPGGPVDCGFDTFFGFRASTDIPPYFYIRGDRAVTPPTDYIEGHHSPGWASNQGEFWRGGGIAPGLALKDVLPRFTGEALHVIESQVRANQDGRKPFLLYYAPTGPHTPWLPSPEFVGKSGAGMYGDFTMMVDAEIGRILAALDQSGLAGNTLVIFTSDNGPVWYEADVERFGHASAGGWRGMKSDAWEGGHRMPFIVRWPGRVQAGTVTDQTICFTDLLATFAEICGATLPDDAGPDSFSFLPVLDGVQPADKAIRPPIVMHAGSAASMMMIRSGDWKLINGLGSGGFTRPSTIKPKPGEPAVQLYNLRTDPAETTNLAAQHPDKVKELLAALQATVDRGRSR